MSLPAGDELDAMLVEVRACPLCGSARGDAESVAPANLYSEQLALVVGCDEARLLETVHNRRCADCGLWYKPSWFRPDVLRVLFTERVPSHPKGWDAVSDRFSERGFAQEVEAYRRAVAGGSALEGARCRRSLASIVDSIVGIEGAPLRRQLLDAITGADADALEALQPALRGRFAEPAAFKRFSGFSSRLLWEWMESHVGPVHRYGEVGCPLWGQLARVTGDAVERHFFVRPENNYWGDGCRRDGRHCCQKLMDGGGIGLQPWPPAADLRLDALGAFQYLDHLQDPVSFVAEALRGARALLLILDGVDAPLAIQHFTGWDAGTIARLADIHGKSVACDFTTIEASGNRAWLLH
jgi:hypothetical protein